MKIVRIELYSVAVDIHASLTRYGSQQLMQPDLDTVVVRLSTDTGLLGWGEAGTAPAYYLPETSAATRGGIAYAAPMILGQDPRRIRLLNHRLQQALRGHGSAKSALDMALLDLCGKAQGLPLCDLWGGRVSADVPVLAVIPVCSLEEALAHLARHREAGYSRFQVKLGGGSTEDDIRTIRQVSGLALAHERLWFDPNRAWLVDDAIRVIAAVRDLSPMIENPCESYEECRLVAQRMGIPFMLDEVIDSPRRFLQAAADGVMDVASLKLNSFGGLSRLRPICDLGVELGIPMRIENFTGTAILLAAVTQLAVTIPERLVFGLYDYAAADQKLVRNPLRVTKGRVGLGDSPLPGLGVEVDESALGQALATFS